MKGIITKINADKCEVKIEKEVVICTMRGKMRSMELLPLVGDNVIVDLEKKQILKVVDRVNKLRRPEVANVTQGLIVASLKKPDFDTNLIDKLIIELEFNHIKPIICFSKKDLLSETEYKNLVDDLNYYRSIYPVYFNDEIDDIKKIFKDQITVIMGQTGAGKSTLLNRLDNNLNLETGEISDALGRGRHTTRLVSLYELFDGFVLDTPGFSSLEFGNMTKLELRDCYRDFPKNICPYRDCLHINEDDCGIKLLVKNNKIREFRYHNYLSFQKQTLNNYEKYKRKD